MSDFSALEKSVYRTLGWFDIFDRPLTLLELHNFLYQNASVVRLKELKDYLDSQDKFFSRQGFYFLNNRRELIDKRIAGHKIYANKLKIAYRAASKIAWLPGVKMIGMCNNWYMTESSDIDFFIIAEKNRLWAVRLWVTFILHFWRLRRHRDKIADRVCLSFYISRDSLDLSRIKLSPDDPYLDFWIANLLPLYDEQNFYADFIAANESSISNFINWRPNEFCFAYRLKKVGWLGRVWRSLLPRWLGDAVNKLACNVQQYKISLNQFDQSQRENSHVVISDRMLKFHENDRRELYRQKFKKYV